MVIANFLGASVIGLAPLDYGVFYSILALTIFWGLWTSLGDKVSSFKEYALSGGNIGTVPLAFAIVSTCLGGGVLSYIGDIAHNGIIMAVIHAFWAVQFLFAAYWIAPQMDKFADCLTIGDIASKCYSERTAIFMGFVWMGANIMSTGLCYLAIGRMLAMIMDSSVAETTLLVGITITFYAAISSGRSMGITGALLFMFLTLTVLLMASVIVVREGGPLCFINQVEQGKFTLLGHPELWRYVVLFIVCKVFPSDPVTLHVVQRMLIIRDTKRIKKTMLNIAIFCVIFPLLLVIIGLAGHMHFPDVPVEHIFYSVVTYYIPHGLKGFMLAGVIALVISGRDFNLYARSLVIVRNVLRPLTKSKPWAIDDVHLAKGAIVVVGLGGTLLSLYFENVIRTLSFMFGIITPLTEIPILAAILCSQVSTVSYRNCVIATVTAILVSKYFVPGSLEYIIPLITLTTGVVSYTVTHLFIRYFRPALLES